MTAKKEKSNINTSNNNTSSIQLFYYEGLSVRTVNIDGEIWFVAKDVADILGYADATHATRYLDDDEKALLNSNENTLLNWESIQEGEETQTIRRGNPNIIIISEPGLYELVFRSNKPDAKAFSRWVRHDVLPSIRKNGGYSLESNARDNDTTRQIIREQNNLNQRIRFWKSIYEAAIPLFNILLHAPQGFYIVPDEISRNRTERSEVNLLRGMIINLKEFIADKISALEQKGNLIKKIIDD